MSATAERFRLPGLRLAWESARTARAAIFGGLLALAGSLAFEFAGPLFVREYVDTAMADGEAPHLLRIALLYLGVSLGGIVTGLLVSYLSAQAGWGIADGIRRRLLSHQVARPVLELEGLPPGSLLEAIEGNADIIGRSISEAGFRIIGNLVLLAGSVIILFIITPPAGVVIAALLVAVTMILLRLTRRSVRLWTGVRAQRAHLFGFLGDGLAACDDALPLGESRWVGARARTLLDRLLVQERRAYVGGRAFWPLVQLFFAISFGLGFGFGLKLVGHGEISIGTLTLIYLYVDLLRGPLEDLSSQVDAVQRLLAALSVASSALDAPGARPAAVASARRLPPGPLGVELDDVTFGYGDRPVLREASCRVPPGQTVGIVGRTGAGKSTIVSLLCGLVPAQKGRVLIGDVDVGELAPEELSDRVAVLSQRIHIFAASVKDNITLFDDAIPDEAVWQVLDHLGAAGRFRHLPAGLSTPIGAGGEKLSDGEGQLIASARALIRPSSLLVIDEGTSRLDPETERAWSAVVERVRRERTVIMVAHRTATLRHVDGLLMVEGGRITHTDADAASYASVAEPGERA